MTIQQVKHLTVVSLTPYLQAYSFIQLKVQAKASEEIKGTVDDAKLFFLNLLC